MLSRCGQITIRRAPPQFQGIRRPRTYDNVLVSPAALRHTARMDATLAAHLCSLRWTAVFRACISVIALLLVLVVRERAMATPVFAQAYGLSCTACHTQMPILNAFGRYVQRTGYAALSPQALKHALPLFPIDNGTTYTHQSDKPSRITGPSPRSTRSRPPSPL